MEFVRALFDTSDFPPRWHCGLWSSGHGWTHIISDILIGVSYYAIPAILIYFIIQRKDLPFPKIFWLFGAFIFACGTGHLVESMIFWWPAYRLSAVVKAATALVSMATVVVLVPNIPRVLRFPTLEKVNKQLRIELENNERVRSDLAQTNEDLQRMDELTLGREQRIMELKKEVNELLKLLNREPRYGAV